jgi:hypothetical protein
VISAKRSSGILRVIVLTEGRYYPTGRIAIPEGIAAKERKERKKT